MSHYAEYIWPCYIGAFCFLGLQLLLAYLAWKKCINFFKDRYP